MLPPGHAAAGFLLAHAAIQLSGVQYSQTYTNDLLLLGAFSGFAPDLDMFWAFAKAKGFSFGKKDVNHRGSVLHTPLFWIGLGLFVGLAAPGTFGILAGFIIAIGALSHLFLDSFKMGIRWLWPFSNKYYAFLYAGEHEHYQSKTPGFFNFWIGFLKTYATEKAYRPTFILEIIILASAVILLCVY